MLYKYGSELMGEIPSNWSIHACVRTVGAFTEGGQGHDVMQICSYADYPLCCLKRVIQFGLLPPHATSALVMSILVLQVGTMRQELVRDYIILLDHIIWLSTQKQPKTSEQPCCTNVCSRDWKAIPWMFGIQASRLHFIVKF